MLSIPASVRSFWKKMYLMPEGQGQIKRDFSLYDGPGKALCARQQTALPAGCSSTMKVLYYLILYMNEMWIQFLVLKNHYTDWILSGSHRMSFSTQLFSTDWKCVSPSCQVVMEAAPVLRIWKIAMFGNLFEVFSLQEMGKSTTWQILFCVYVCVHAKIFSSRALTGFIALDDWNWFQHEHLFWRHSFIKKEGKKMLYKKCNIVNTELAMHSGNYAQIFATVIKFIGEFRLVTLS